MHATIYLTDAKDYAAVDAVWSRWLEGFGKPARACVVVGTVGWQGSKAKVDVRVAAATGTAPVLRRRAAGSLSEWTYHNGVGYISGQTGRVQDLAVSDMARQTRDALDKIDSVLKDVGFDKSRVLTATVYLKDMGDDARTQANHRWAQQW